LRDADVGPRDEHEDDGLVGGDVAERAPVEQSWLWREAWLSDPDGYHTGDIRRFPPWRLPE